MESPVSNPVTAPRADGLPSSPLVVGRAFLLGMVLLIFVGYLAYCAFNFGLSRFEDADARRVKERQKILADRLAEDAKWLHGAPSWFNKEKQIVRAPIDEAMRLTAKELAAIPPHPADPIELPPPPAAAAPAASPAPQASPAPAAPPMPAPAEAAPSPAPAEPGASPSTGQ